MVNVYTIAFGGREYLVADIPDVITDSESRLLIGTHSLNNALYDDKNGYIDSTAESIDEQIYAYIDDQYFTLGYSDFLAKIKELLD